MAGTSTPVMNEIRENIFYIPFGERVVVYAPLAGVCAMINSSAARQLDMIISNPDAPAVSVDPEVEKLREELTKGEVRYPEEKTGKLSPHFLGIIPTRQCNGACIYCDFTPPKELSGKMTPETASVIADWYMDIVEAENRPVAAVHFFGGEPVLAGEVMEIILHKVRMRSFRKQIIPSFEITTNGQYTAKQARFVGNYFNKVVLSLDGPAAIHNRQRPLKNGQDSYANAVRTAHIISGLQASLCLRACISGQNVERLEEITARFCESFAPESICFEVLSANDNTVKYDLAGPDPILFARNFSKARKLGREFGTEVIYASDIQPEPVISSCPVGKDTAIFTPDGMIASCYLIPDTWRTAGLDLDFGSIDRKGEISIEPGRVDGIRKLVKDKWYCEKCFCRWSCAGGCHVRLQAGAFSLGSPDFCRQTRIISLCTLLSWMGQEEAESRLWADPGLVSRIADQRSDMPENLANLK